jgi:hypothetical protein
MLAQKMFLIEDTIATQDAALIALAVPVAGGFEDAIDDYKDFVKEEHDLKVKKENNTTYIIEVVDMPHVSIKRGDLKTYLFHTDTAEVMAFCFQLGYDIFLSTAEYPTEMSQFKKFVIKYLEHHYKNHYQGRIDLLTRDFDQYKKDLGQNEKEINGLKKKVATIDKKLLKEKDEIKITKLNSDKQLLENEIEQLSNLLPDKRELVHEKEQEIAAVKDEYHQMHLSIGALDPDRQ